jgi:thioredoxin 1
MEGEMGIFDRFLKKPGAGDEEKVQTLDSLAEDEYPTMPLKVGEDDFDTVIQRFPVVVVDCWAPWCMPCLMVAPIVAELAKDYTGKIVFCKLNVDENLSIAMKYGIQSIPTLLVLQNGELVDQIIGAMPRRDLENRVTKYLTA